MLKEFSFKKKSPFLNNKMGILNQKYKKMIKFILQKKSSTKKKLKKLKRTIQLN